MGVLKLNLAISIFKHGGGKQGNCRHARGQQTFKDHPPREINCFGVAACAMLAVIPRHAAGRGAINTSTTSLDNLFAKLTRRPGTPLCGPSSLSIVFCISMGTGSRIVRSRLLVRAKRASFAGDPCPASGPLSFFEDIIFSPSLLAVSAAVPTPATAQCIFDGSVLTRPFRTI